MTTAIGGSSTYVSSRLQTRQQVQTFSPMGFSSDHIEVDISSRPDQYHDGEKANNEMLVEPPEAYLTSWRLAIVTFFLCLGTFFLALDINSIGVAVAVFDSLDDVAWYGSAYLPTVAAFQPITGLVYK